MNININNFAVYFKGDIVAKLNSWICGWIESTFSVNLPFILHQFVSRVDDSIVKLINCKMSFVLSMEIVFMITMDSKILLLSQELLSRLYYINLIYTPLEFAANKDSWTARKCCISRILYHANTWHSEVKHMFPTTAHKLCDGVLKFYLFV